MVLVLDVTYIATIVIKISNDTMELVDNSLVVGYEHLHYIIELPDEKAKVAYYATLFLMLHAQVSYTISIEVLVVLVDIVAN